MHPTKACKGRGGEVSRAQYRSNPESGRGAGESEREPGFGAPLGLQGGSKESLARPQGNRPAATTVLHLPETAGLVNAVLGQWLGATVAFRKCI